MAIIKKDGNFMGLPMNIARGNPIPLDASEIWYSLEELKTYAKESPVAYVGQILGLVDETNQTSTAYIILNCEGDVQEVGKALLADNNTIVIEDETLSLKDFGKYFYKYIAATGTKEENNYIAAHYQKQVVDPENPWRAGLEPKVVEENGKMVLGWYEPNPTTIEGVSTAITGLQNTVNNLTIANTNLTTKIDNTYTKSETDAKIAAAAHLKRMEVSSKDLIDPNADGADQYIYMVPSGLTADDNKYYEYMVVEVNGVKKVERVGSWEVDLSDYLKKADAELTHSALLNSLNDLNAEIAKVDAKAEINFINAVSDNFEVSADEERKLFLKSVPNTIDLSDNTSLLNLFVQKDANKDLLSLTEITKLATVEMYAEKNAIDSVDADEFTITGDIERKLSINKIDGVKLINLDNNTDFSAVKADVSTAKDTIKTIRSELDGINQQITGITTNYVQKSTYDEEVANIWDRLTWHDLD